MHQSVQNLYRACEGEENVAENAYSCTSHVTGREL
jgi:hypothetical protein